MNNSVVDSIKITIVGGCHVGGAFLDGQPSFVDIINKMFKPSSLIKKSGFQLKNVSQLEHLYSHYSSDIIILQLGNNEFNPGLNSLFPIRKKNNDTTGRERKLLTDQEKFHRHNFLFEKIIWFMSPLRWLYAISHNKRYLEELFLQIQNYGNKQFIVISPFPKTMQNYSRKQASSYYRRLFGKLPNVAFIDSFNYIPSKKDYFNDMIHLNERGHQLLAEPVCEKISHFINHQ